MPMMWRVIWIHHDHDPEALEQNGITSEEIDAPQTVLHVPMIGTKLAELMGFY